MEASDTGIEQGRGTEQSQKIPVSEPEAIRQPLRPTLISKLSEVRTVAQANLQRLNILLNGEGENPPVDARSIIEELARPEENPSEYLRRSTVALGGSARLTQQLSTEIETLSSNREGVKWQIEHRLKQLDKLRGFRKIPAILERMRLNKQKTAIEQEADAMNSQIQHKRDSLTLLQEGEKPVKQRKD